MRSWRPLPRAFFERPVVELAAALLGALLVRRLPDGTLLAGRVVETEAYGGRRVDPSAHSFKGPTPRCRVMFGPAGHAYVYATQGRCCCVNVTAEGGADGRAVLLRALEPVLGVERMRAHRLSRLADGPTRARLLAGAAHELARGPGRLCLALDVDRALDGHDLTAADALWIARPEASGDDGAPTPDVRWTPRVGLNPASASFDWRWRAFDAGSRSVSPGPRGARPARAPRPARCPSPDA